MATDPVCGMQVDEKTAAHKSEHGDQTATSARRLQAVVR
jgi:hypothetical protein